MFLKETEYSFKVNNVFPVKDNSLSIAFIWGIFCYSLLILFIQNAVFMIFKTVDQAKVRVISKTKQHQIKGGNTTDIIVVDDTIM